MNRGRGNNPHPQRTKSSLFAGIMEATGIEFAQHSFRFRDGTMLNPR
jgi:hypothetical protein